ncbi:L-2-amino-thiazoline-4-carboxylic acid hydrolase [Myxococcota bacterium]|nr:L-2-amino-thiazoline-4-carboxylic acid hydrolase [Myxococcota bacterium]
MSKPDRLTQKIGALNRREVEARILAPVIDAMAEAFGRDEVMEIVSKTIREIARNQGAEMSAFMNDQSASSFVKSLEAWTRDGALDLEMLQEKEGAVDFNVNRCRYAEMYEDLGIPELGKILSCGRDSALIEGFSPNAKLSRQNTILSGATHCDFRYRFPEGEEEERDQS